MPGNHEDHQLHHGDHMDGEKFSMAQFQTRIDAFMEMILEKKWAS
jgi:hypothetical protein